MNDPESGARRQIFERLAAATTPGPDARPPGQDAPDASKRATAAAAAIATLAVLTAVPNEARADISFGDLNDALQDTEDLLSGLTDLTESINAETILQREILQAAFTLLAAAGIPPLFMQLLHCLIPGGGGGGFGIPGLCSLINSVVGGENVMHRSDRVRPVMDALWPAEPFEVIEASVPGKDKHTRTQYNATFEQVQAAGITLASAAEAQADLADADAAAIADINAAGEAGNLVTIAAKHAQLTATNSQRLSQIIAMLNAAFPVMANHPMQEHWDRVFQVADRHRMREGLVDQEIVGPQPTGVGGGGGGGAFGFGGGDG